MLLATLTRFRTYFYYQVSNSGGKNRRCAFGIVGTESNLKISYQIFVSGDISWLNGNPYFFTLSGVEW